MCCLHMETLKNMYLLTIPQLYILKTLNILILKNKQELLQYKNGAQT